DACAQIFLRIVDGLVRAIVFAYCKLRFARRGSDDARAHRLADLHRRQSHAARSAQHQQRLAGFELSAILERVIGRPIGEHKCRSSALSEMPGRGISTFFCAFASLCALCVCRSVLSWLTFATKSSLPASTPPRRAGAPFCPTRALSRSPPCRRPHGP